MSRSRLVAYWVTTAILALVLFSGGFFQAIKQTGAVEGITSLGYPVYFVTSIMGAEAGEPRPRNAPSRTGRVS